MSVPVRSDDPKLDLDDDAAPDSSIRPTTPPPAAKRSEEGTRLVELSIRVSAMLLGLTGSAYVTITATGGAVFFEGEIGVEGGVELCLAVPEDTTHLRALLEAGTKYRNAILEVRARGVTVYTFA